MKLFYGMALKMYKWACIRGLRFPVNRQLELDLEKLYPGQNQKQISMEYHVNKLAKSLLICAISGILGLVVTVKAGGNKLLTENGEVIRGDYQEGTAEMEVVCDLPEGEKHFKVQVGARIYDAQQIGELYESFCQELPSLVLGENTSLNNVTENLCLDTSYEDYPFEVEWTSSVPDVLSVDGTVKQVGEQAQRVELSAQISYGEEEWNESLMVEVQAAEWSAEELLYQELNVLLQSTEADSRTEEVWRLPDTLHGQELRWKEVTRNNGWLVAAGGVLVAVLVYLMADKDLHNSVEKRKAQMKRDYPDVVHKLTLYLGAGMTIRWSFQKIAEEYEADKREGKKEVFIYEEIARTCRELKAGVSEGAAYEYLGRRTGLQEYIRLSTLLAQNLKKGNGTLVQRMEEEAEKASIERIQNSRRLGEEAVTKLLLPMVLMLLVVMLMIMIPAFSSMGS